MTTFPDIECVLKGHRGYAQAADVTNALLDLLKKSTPNFAFSRLDLSFRHQIRSVLRVRPLTIENQTHAAVTGLVDAGQVWRLGLEEVDVPLVRRQPFDELVITRQMVTDTSAQRCFGDFRSPYSELETWVSLNKALHVSCFPNVVGRWMCVRLVLSGQAALDPIGKRELHIEANFLNRLTRTSLWRAGHKVGEMYFSVTED